MWPSLTTPLHRLLQQDNAALLIIYFTLNTAITLMNKLVATESPDHHVASLLGATHAAATWVGCIVYQRFTPKPDPTATILTSTQRLALFAFALLYTTNISLSNYSTALASLPMWQSIRATGPLLTVLIVLLAEGPSTLPANTSAYISLFAIIAGVVVSVHGERWDATVPKLSWTFAGALAAVVKSYVQHRLPKYGVRLPANDLLLATLPYAVVQGLLGAAVTGEIGPLVHQRHDISTRFTVLFALSAAVAFCLNIVSFRAFERVAPTSMAVAANLKQMVILFLPFHLQPITGQVVVGTLITVCGTIWYSVLQMRRKRGGSGGGVESVRFREEEERGEEQEVEGK